MHTLMALWVCLQDYIVERSHAVTFSLSVICVEAQRMETLPVFTATGQLLSTAGRKSLIRAALCLNIVWKATFIYSL